MKRIFILNVAVSDSSGTKIERLRVVRNSLDEVLTSKEDLKNVFEYKTITVESIEEVEISDIVFNSETDVEPED